MPESSHFEEKLTVRFLLVVGSIWVAASPLELVLSWRNLRRDLVLVTPKGQ